MQNTGEKKVQVIIKTYQIRVTHMAGGWQSSQKDSQVQLSSGR